MKYNALASAAAVPMVSPVRSSMAPYSHRPSC